MGRKQHVVEITGLEPNRRVEITTQTGPMRPIATYRFKPANGGTRLAASHDPNPTPPGPSKGVVAG
jgi:hypothetical protein